MLYVHDELSAFSNFFDLILGKEADWDEISLYDICELIDLLDWNIVNYEDLKTGSQRACRSLL